MSLFDATAVTPPTPCSRCGETVLATSLFCPQCGQSMVRPSSRVAPQAAPAPAAPVDSETPVAEPQPQGQTPGWLRRSLNLGRKPANAVAAEPERPEVATSDLQATQQMSLFEIEQAEAVALQKSPKRQAASARFVLIFEGGTSVTVGEHPGVIGVKPINEGDPPSRIYVEDESDTVAPEHLEYGVDKGVFWVQDLKTVNGTVVEEPGAEPVQCVPYEKYFVVRGSTIRIGKLSFTLN